MRSVKQPDRPLTRRASPAHPPFSPVPPVALLSLAITQHFRATHTQHSELSTSSPLGSVISRYEKGILRGNERLGEVRNA